MRPSFRFWWFVGNAVLSFCSLVSPAKSVETSDLGAVAYRVAMHEGGGTAYGSGTAIAPHFVLTNAHVVDNRAGQAAFVAKSGGQWITGRVVACNPSIDMALVQVADELDYAGICDRDVVPGEVTTYCGFGGTGKLELKRGEIKSKGRFRLASSGPDVVELSPNSISGDSGSGVFNTDHQLIAIVWGSDYRDAQAVSAQEFVAWKPAIETAIKTELGCCIGGRCPPRGGYSQPPRQTPPPLGHTIPQAPGRPLVNEGFDKLQSQVNAIDGRLKQLESLSPKLDSALSKLDNLKPLEGVPGPAGPQGPPGPKGDPGQACKCEGASCKCDEASIVSAVLKQIKEHSTINPTVPPVGNPTPSHFVLVADLESYEYRKLESSWLVPARKSLPGHVVNSKQINFSVTPLPQVVVYDTRNTPISIAKGGYEVEKTLQSIAQR